MPASTNVFGACEVGDQAELMVELFAMAHALSCAAPPQVDPLRPDTATGEPVASLPVQRKTVTSWVPPPLV